MMDAPSSIYIEYKNLTKDTSLAEQQKDLISAVLKKTEGQNQTLIEVHPESLARGSLPKDSVFLYATCVQCPVSSQETWDLNLNSIIKNKKQNGSEISFVVINAQNQKSEWKIELTDKNNLPQKIKSTSKIELPRNVKWDAETELGPKLKRAPKVSEKPQKIEKEFKNSTLVRAGETVHFSYELENGILIQGKARALSNASQGETLRVEMLKPFAQNVKGEKDTTVVDVTVVSRGEVKYAR